MFSFDTSTHGRGDSQLCARHKNKGGTCGLCPSYSLSCPHHITLHIELPHPSPALAHARTKALTQGGPTVIQYPVVS